MLEFNDNTLDKISEKLLLTRENSFYFKQLYEEYNQERYEKKFERMNDCLSLWVWDRYEQNKILDLQKVNRCMDRFCPNCRSISLSRSLQEFAPKNKEMLMRGYEPYLITLTVPNVKGDDLADTIKKMGKAFAKLNRWLYEDIHVRGSYKNRNFRISAAIKTLEITVQKNDNDYYHPHYHILAYIENGNQYDFIKDIPGAYSDKKQEQMYNSNNDLHIMKLWKLAYDNRRITDYNKLSDNWYDLYMCDIREMDIENGIYEVFKYTFKDTDIKNYKNFKDIYFSTFKKRLRQGHGELYNLKLEFDEMEKEKEPLELEISELPDMVMSHTIESIKQDYQNYRKISRFKGHNQLNEVL